MEPAQVKVVVAAIGVQKASIATMFRICRQHHAPLISSSTRAIQTTASSIVTTSSPDVQGATSDAEPLTHYRITLRRSAIGLPKRSKATLEALGIHRRMQTVYHKHTPESAGKILAVKELVEVENVPASMVRTKEEMTRERRHPKGYEVVTESET